jgi:hypothetical protein
VDRRFFTDLLSRNLGPNAAGPRFDWLYLQNPHGLACAWVAIEEVTGQMTGAAAVFPRKFSLGGTPQPGYVLGDFCIDPRCRSLGLALKLQRTSLDHLRSTASFVTCDFPSDRMMAIYQRLQIDSMGQLVRWAKPLRGGRTISKFVKSARWAGRLATLGDKILKWRDMKPPSNGGWSVEEHQGECGEEFTKLMLTVSSRYLCVDRSAEYLNWRYLKHPLIRHRMLTARRGSELSGYIVFSETSEDAKVADLFGLPNAAMWTALVYHVVALLHARGITTVSVPALDTNPWTGLLKRWGFFPRDGHPVVLCFSKDILASGNPQCHWLLTDGDRES